MLTSVSKNVHRPVGGETKVLLGRPQKARDAGASAGDTVGARRGWGAGPQELPGLGTPGVWEQGRKASLRVDGGRGSLAPAWGGARRPPPRQQAAGSREMGW